MPCYATMVLCYYAMPSYDRVLMFGFFFAVHLCVAWFFCMFFFLFVGLLGCIVFSVNSCGGWNISQIFLSWGCKLRM
ncbi:hypothetical protein FPQ18DRAFT_113238 [Pyronema domesticum]|nr:hypothetical protein FPQ18DRAFT_113238 [Pyronema domesticum]